MATVLIGVGGLAILAAAGLLASFGERLRIGRLLAGTPTVDLADLPSLARSARAQEEVPMTPTPTSSTDTHRTSAAMRRMLTSAERNSHTMVRPTSTLPERASDDITSLARFRTARCW